MKYRFLFPIMTLATMLLSSCAEEELVPQNGSRSCVQFVGRVPGFADYDVTTRAAKTPEESAIKYMTLLIYDNADILISKQSIESSVPLFVVDRGTLNSSTDNGINQADVYMIANVSQEEIKRWNVQTVSDLMAVKHEYDVASLNIPADGFPMMGSMKNVDLNPDYNNIPDSKIEIPLENLFAKIVFNIRLETIQDYFSPSFQMTNWEVHNLPKGFGLVGTQNDGQTSFYNDTFDDPVSSRRFTGANPVTGSNSLSFSFYMPEHKVNPAVEASDYSYPAGISDNEKQRFKPCLVDKECNPAIPAGYDGEPTYVVINGVFTDHQNHQYVVSYKVYLGSDNWQNFQVERNGQYNNSIVIRGITNSQSGEDGSVSIDHRVNVDANHFMVHMERETMLDSHIEVRPLQIQILDAGDGVDQKIKVYLANPSDPSKAIENNEMTWARMEVVNSAMNTSAYCPYDSKNRGRRKYFTTSLLSELKNKVEAELTSETNNLWLYFDENTNVSTNGTREIVLVLEYYENNVLKTTKHYTFSQHDLYPVIYQDEEAGIEYRYDIEFFEEYLYNYNPDDDFNSTVAGMPWGPKNTISYEIMAIQDVQSWWANNLKYIEDAIKKAGGYYDFQNNFWGRKYTTKLINVMDQGVLTQDAMPQSAAQHCHNKNKRNADGTVPAVQWYLPAIGELQHIMSSAYSKFEVFQDNRYWSSQTSYRRGHFKYDVALGLFGSVEGDFFYEDKEWARATKTTYNAGNYSYEPSEVQGISKTWNGSVINQTGRFSAEVAPSSRDSGNRQRDEINRVRAVRNKWKRNIGYTEWEEITTEE
ncbi:MAG: DUF4906 domain-containing protein [Bacteroidaceae bacterium]|nr:DUF4906 domain-containing protein [Bacteroidaceae bacterium]